MVPPIPNPGVNVKVPFWAKKDGKASCLLFFENFGCFLYVFGPI